MTDKQFRDTAAVIRQVQQTEHRWLKQGDMRSDYLPWMPFQSAEFLAIMFDCAEQARGNQFLDVGAGPGTKMLLARHFFGFDPRGIEVDEEMARAAQVYGEVLPYDALKAPENFYAGFDLIWLYRPFRNIELEWQLEERIFREMKPGAILAGGQWETCPADLGWIPVVDDWELRRGAWKRPIITEDIELP